MITLDELKAALLKWDAINGGYPEHEFEGFTFWDWFTNGQPDDLSNFDTPEASEREDAWCRELEKLRR